MGIGDMFGFGKKEPFRVPADVVMLRTRIAAEERENYPNLARFKELQRDAAVVYKSLNAIIARKDYADDALRVREDIKKRLEALETKIAANMRAAKSEDYVEDNMEYLERKSTRNAAKTLFTEFLEAHELLTRSGRSGPPAQGGQALAATSKILQTLSNLQRDYFSKHGQDREIRGLQEKMCRKLSELKGLRAEVMAAIGEHAVREAVAENLRKIAAFAEDCR
jgi:hypothetical protein